MREFTILAPSQSLSVDAGMLTRFLVGALLLSHGVRPDARALVFFDGQSCISFEGGSMRNVRPDEQSLSGILRAGLNRIRRVGGGRVMQGIHAYEKPFEEYVAERKQERGFYYSGSGARSSGFGQDFALVFQYPKMSAEVEERLRRAGFRGVRLCKSEVSPDQGVVVFNNIVDRSAPREGLAKVRFQEP